MIFKGRDSSFLLVLKNKFCVNPKLLLNLSTPCQCTFMQNQCIWEFTIVFPVFTHTGEQQYGRP